MRFESLTLERYGAFERRTMAFETPGLTVVYGPNEAGKSTSLAAVGDFLFGVPDRSLRGAVFGNDAIRLEATLARADGSRLALRRRKGRARTLTGLDGAPADDGLLGALLGATTRERFDTLFGLDHERLRRGGERLLAADGEIGRLIVEAGGGLRSLVDRLKAIDQTLDRLFATRRSGDRAYYKALDAFEAADRDVKAGLLTREAYERSKAAHGETETVVTRLRAARRELVQRVSGLERMARVIPLLGALDRIVEGQAAFADLPPLPDAFDADVAAAIAGARDAAKALAEAEAAAQALAAKLAAVVVDPALVAAEARVRDADERRVVVANARGDRPNRLKELAQAETRLEGLRRLVGAGADDDLASMLPAPEAVEAVRRLAAAAQARAPKISASRGRIADLEGQLGRLDARLAAAQAKGFDRASGVVAADLAGLPAMASAVAERTKAADAANNRAEIAARGLGFADVAAVRAFRCPDAETMTRMLERDGRLGERGQAHHDARTAAEAKRDAALSEIARLQAGGEVATDAALAGARGARDAAWGAVRAAHAQGRPDPDAALRSDQVRAVDDAIVAADALADRRTGEARRVAALAQAERERDGAVAAHAAATAALTEIERSAAALKAELAEAFPDAVARAPGLLALKAFSDERRAVLVEAETATAASAEAEAARAALDAPLQALAFAERACRLPSGGGVGERVRAALAAAAAHDAAHAEHRRDIREREDAVTALQRAVAERAELEREEQVRLDAWGPALKRLGLSEGAAPDDAGVAAHEWQGARGVLEAIATARRRLKRMDDDEVDLARRVGEIGVAAKLDLPEDPVAAAKMLHDRFRANDEARGRRETLAPGATEAAGTAALRRRELDERKTALAALSSIAGLAGDDAGGALSEIAARHAARRALHEDEARARASVVAAGDGRVVDDLRAAVADRDLDAVTADVAAAQAETDDLDHALDQAIRAEHEAAAVLAGHHGAAGVNRAVTLRESATADLHDVVERYVELSLARDLVEAAIARVRAEQQDPLVTRAGALFAQVTRNEFSGVAADVDDRGEPVVVGVRASGGGAIGAAAMSDGTRDQLFLAFRLASLEAYAGVAEPLPFVADDVLVHFDDARSRATLELLADFGRVTQVLLFTHHRSVLAMAEELAGDGRCGVVTLG